MACQPMSFQDTLTALDEILHLAAQRNLDLRDITRFSAFVLEQLLLRQARHGHDRVPEPSPAWTQHPQHAQPMTGCHLCMARQVRTVLAWQQSHDDLIPLDPLDVAECPCDRHAPYFMDLAGINEAAEEVEG